MPSKKKPNPHLTTPTLEEKKSKAIRGLAKNEKVPVLPPKMGNTLSLAFRDSGGIEAMVDLCLYCSGIDERCARIAYIWQNTIIDDRSKVIPEELCRQADIQPAELLGVLAGAAFQRNIDVSKLMLALNHSAVLGKTIEFAQQADGHQDRKILHQASGLLPVGGKGVNIAIQNNLNKEKEEERDGGMPDFASDCILVTSD